MNFCKGVSISLYTMKSSKNIFIKLFRYSLNVFLTVLWNVGNPFFTLKGRVVKTNVTWSLCIKHHIGFHHDASIASIKIDAWKDFITLGLPPLCMAIEMDLVATRFTTKFSIPMSLKIFGHQLSVTIVNNQNFLVTNFWSP